MRRLAVIGVLALGFAFSTDALAQTTPKQKPAERVTELIFDGDVLDGERAGPEVTRINVRDDVKFKNLIRIRTNFRIELRQSVHSL